MNIDVKLNEKLIVLNGIFSLPSVTTKNDKNTKIAVVNETKIFYTLIAERFKRHKYPIDVAEL